MAAEAALVARLEARMDKYEKAMKGAEETADKTVKGIENSFASTTIGTTLGNVIARGLTGAIEAAVKVAKDLIEEFQRLQGVAEATGITLQQAFAIEKVLGPGGATVFEKIAEQLDRMQRGEKNYLSRLFDENGIKNIKTAQEAMEQIRRIFGDVASIQVKEIAKGLGLDDAQVKKLQELPGTFKAATDAAAAGLPDLARIAQAAEDFEALWKKALQAVKLFLAETFQDMKAPVADFIAQTLRGLQVLVEALGLFADLTRSSAAADQFAKVRDNIAGAAKEVDAFALASRQLGPRLSEMTKPARGEEGGPEGAPKFRAPGFGGSKAAAGGSTSLDAFEREERRATERTAQLELEATLVGKTTAERTKALETLRLEQMAIRENLTLDDARRATIDKIAEGYAKSTANLEAARRAQDRMMFFGNTLVDALDRATTAGAKLKDIISDIGAVMKRALIQGLITGQGPFGGGTGTGLFSLLPKFASGGVVPGTGPVPIMAHGGEVVVPRAVAQSGGMGATFAPIYNIDARGAQLGVAEQITAALSANNRALQTNLPAMIRSAQSRGAIR